MATSFIESRSFSPDAGHQKRCFLSAFFLCYDIQASMLRHGFANQRQARQFWSDPTQLKHTYFKMKALRIEGLRFKSFLKKIQSLWH